MRETTCLICTPWLTNISVHLWIIIGGDNNILLKGCFMVLKRLNTYWWIMKYSTRHMRKCILFFFRPKRPRSNVTDRILTRIILAQEKFTFWWGKIQHNKTKTNGTQLQSNVKIANIGVRANIYWRQRQNPWLNISLVYSYSHSLKQMSPPQISNTC